MMSVNVDLVVNELSAQIANLSKEKAIYSALATQYKRELEAAKRELEQLKKSKDQSPEK
jgi:hypothetical protein